jgi:hypothetical protein
VCGRKAKTKPKQNKKFGPNLFSSLTAMHKKTANNAYDTSGPVVSQNNNLSMWLFTGDRHMLHEIRLKSIRGSAALHTQNVDRKHL